MQKLRRQVVNYSTAKHGGSHAYNEMISGVWGVLSEQLDLHWVLCNGSSCQSESGYFSPEDGHDPRT